MVAASDPCQSEQRLTTPAKESLAGSPTVAETATPVPAIRSAAAAPLAAALLDWQRTCSTDRFEQLVAAARPVAEIVVAGVLRRRGIRDPLAIDDAIALVLDHLRRLSPTPGEPRTVTHFKLAAFEPSPADPDAPPADSGLAYIARLARHRAVDVARQRHRQTRQSVAFSQLDPAESQRLHDRTVAKVPAAGVSSSPDDHLARLEETLPQLPPRERLVVELLLAGKSQTVIAHLLDVCEGTVSRLRTKAVASLRLLLAE